MGLIFGACLMIDSVMKQRYKLSPFAVKDAVAAAVTLWLKEENGAGSASLLYEGTSPGEFPFVC